MGKKICGIYCIENLVNGKKYVGQSIDIKSRFSKHKSLLRLGKHKNIHLQGAWDTYGENNFSFYVIEECPQEELDSKEQNYISNMDLRNPDVGYNIEPGGFTNKRMSDETREKISRSLKGREFTDEHRAKIGEANRHRIISDETRQKMRDNHADFHGEKGPMYGKHHSEETRKKMKENHADCCGEKNPRYGKHLSEETKRKLSESHKGIFAGEKHPGCRPVYCPELNQRFWGATEAEELYGINRTYISACLSGAQKTAGKHPETGEPLHWIDADNDISL